MSADRPAALIVLAWHNILPTPFFQGSERAFAKQLALVARVANVVSLSEALATMRAGGSLPPRAVALTFDDGYRDNLDVALPIMQRWGLPGTFFLVPGFLDRNVPAWWELVAWLLGRTRARSLDWRGDILPAGPHAPGRRQSAERICEDLKVLTHVARMAEIDALAERLQPAADRCEVTDLFMDWEGARALDGLVDVGAHTTQHPILSRESADYQHRDLAECRRVLEAGLGRQITLLAYPNGGPDDYDTTTTAAAQAAGYTAAVTTRDGINGPDTAPFELHRFVLSPRWDHGMARYLLRIIASARFGRRC